MDSRHGESSTHIGRVLEMQSHTAKQPKGIPGLIAELDRRVKGLAGKTGKTVGCDHNNHIFLAMLDPETQENMMEHIGKNSYEEIESRAFVYLVDVNGITYEDKKSSSTLVIQIEGPSTQE